VRLPRAARDAANPAQSQVHSDREDRERWREVGTCNGTPAHAMAAPIHVRMLPGVCAG
jgi:hypothetical protein